MRLDRQSIAGVNVDRKKTWCLKRGVGPQEVQKRNRETQSELLISSLLLYFNFICADTFTCRLTARRKHKQYGKLLANKKI